MMSPQMNSLFICRKSAKKERRDLLKKKSENAQQDADDKKKTGKKCHIHSIFNENIYHT